MEGLQDFFKFATLVSASLFFLIGFAYFTVEIERSDISKLRYCPHCSKELLV